MSIKPAIDLLKQMREVHEMLVGIAKYKQQTIIHNKTDELIKVTKQENKLVKQIQELDHQRRLWVAHYLNSCNYPVQFTITVSEFSKYVVDSEERAQLMNEQQLLLKTLTELKRINDSNQNLIQDALQYIEFSIDLFAGGDDDVVYQNPAQQGSGVARSSVFDSKA